MKITNTQVTPLYIEGFLLKKGRSMDISDKAFTRLNESIPGKHYLKHHLKVSKLPLKKSSKKSVKLENNAEE